VTTQTYRALLVANSTFPTDAYNLPELEGPRNDPALLRDALCDGEVGLFPADNVRMATERTMAEVLSEAEDLLASASRRDTLLLYYSGHGVLDQSGELFLCTRDSRIDRLRSTAVKASDLRGMMDASAAGVMVVVLDCCHSGRFKGGDIPATLAGRGRFVMTSSRPGELAKDADVRNHASLFTNHLAHGILDGAVDHDGDGIVTLSELYDYVRSALAEEGRQVPQKRFEGDGDVALARRSVTRAVRPPADLVDPISSAPILDVSDTAIHLGAVAADESLPPERIAVINRGGGTLHWTVESSADWVDPVAEDAAVVLRLRPRPGPNRANVYIRDAGGALKTIRVSVRVGERLAGESEADLVAPDPAAGANDRPPPRLAGPELGTQGLDTAAPVTPAPGTPPPEQEAAPADAPTGVAARGRWRDPRWWCVALAVTGVILGIAMAGAIAETVDRIENDSGDDFLVTGLDTDGPLLPDILAGVALVAIGTATVLLAVTRRLTPRAQRRSLACLFAIAAPWAPFLLSDDAALRNSGWGWVLSEVGSFQVAPVLVIFAGLAGFALFKADDRRGGGWVSKRFRALAVAVGLLWVVAMSVQPYTLYDETYGGLYDHKSEAANLWNLLGATVIVALTYVGLRFLSPATGGWLVAAAAATPLIMLVAELAYLAGGGETPDSAAGLWLWIIPTVALVGMSVAAVRRSREVEAHSAGNGVTLDGGVAAAR